LGREVSSLSEGEVLALLAGEGCGSSNAQQCAQHGLYQHTRQCDESLALTKIFTQARVATARVERL
jgi:hypothetical protein